MISLMEPMVARRPRTGTFDGRAYRSGVHAPIPRLGMDETFSYRAAPLPLRRRIDLRGSSSSWWWRRVVVSLLRAVHRWVIDSERRSEALASGQRRGSAAGGPLRGHRRRGGRRGACPACVDAPARADARTALAAAREARRAAARRSPTPGPASSATLERSLIFTDGPSPAPGIVSVASSGGRWAGAVMGDSGTCYWVRLGPTGATFGSGELCTGLAALCRRRRRVVT